MFYFQYLMVGFPFCRQIIYQQKVLIHFLICLNFHFLLAFHSVALYFVKSFLWNILFFFHRGGSIFIQVCSVCIFLVVRIVLIGFVDLKASSFFFFNAHTISWCESFHVIDWLNSGAWQNFQYVTLWLPQVRS